MSDCVLYARAVVDNDRKKIVDLYRTGHRDDTAIVLAIQSGKNDLVKCFVELGMGVNDFALYYARQYRNAVAVNAIATAMAYKGELDF